MSVLAYVLASDDRLTGRLLEWRPPRWVRVWMLAATRLGDGWLWLGTAVVLAVSGHRGLRGRVGRRPRGGPTRGPGRSPGSRRRGRAGASAGIAATAHRTTR